MGLRKNRKKSALTFDGLYQCLGPLFDQASDPRGSGCDYSMSNLLRLGFSMYSLKNSSMLNFGQRSRTETENLSSIYGIEAFCSDNCFRQGLDQADPQYLQQGFSRLAKELESSGILNQYFFRKEHILLSIDGVEYFRSEKVHCPYCLKREHSDGRVEYYHQMLVAVVIHPEQREVYPIACEAIIQQDGSEKNDCERNAAKRLLAHLEQDYSHWKIIVLEDGLYSNGPHLKQLKSCGDMGYIIGLKPTDHKTLIRQFEARAARNQAKTHQVVDEQGIVHQFEWANNLPLNGTHADIRVNFLRYHETKLNGKKTQFSWIVQWKITQTNIFQTMRAARGRWKIENETFNTLKNQGYHFEHNFGHGNRNLASVLAILMLLAFCIDQIQQHGSHNFRSVWKGLKTRKKMWEALRASVSMKKAQSMKQVWKNIAWEYQINIDSS